ncbi:MAG: hypothetical protein AAGA58_11075 [Verrucomicrobiota bacterium]
MSHQLFKTNAKSAALLIILLTVFSSQASVVFYSTEFAWETAVEGEQSFSLGSASNVLLAEEVVTLPGPNTGVGKTLNFLDVNTGLGTDIALTALQQGAGFTFDDNEGSGPEWSGLSVGDINDYQNDNWEAAFSGTPVFSFAFYIGDNGNSNNESLSVFDTNDVLIGTLTAIPATGLSDFIGLTSMVPIGRVVFDEGAGGDDIALNEIYVSTVPIPEAETTLLLALFAVFALRRRR